MSIESEYTVAYIAGSGRSGSTILDMMLGAHSDAFSTGQLAELHALVDTDGHCTCGEPVATCSFWGRVLGSSTNPPGLNASNRVSKIVLTARASAIGLTRTEAAEAAASWHVLDTVAATAGARIVVDSSKALLRLARLDRGRERRRLRVIHLVREPRGYVTSLSFSTRVEDADGTVGYTRVQRQPAAVVDWLANNLLMFVLGLTAFRGRYDVVTYERLVSDPEATLARLARTLTIEFEAGMLPPLARADFHLIGGNSARLAFSKLRYDDKWRRKLRRREQFLINLAAGWLYALLARLEVRQERLPRPVTAPGQAEEEAVAEPR